MYGGVSEDKLMMVVYVMNGNLFYESSKIVA